MQSKGAVDLNPVLQVRTSSLTIRYCWMQAANTPMVGSYKKVVRLRCLVFGQQEMSPALLIRLVRRWAVQWQLPLQ